MTYSADNSSVAAFWHGFTDPESYLHHYEWCTGTSPGDCNLTPFNNVGLAINGNRQLPGSLVLSDGMGNMYSIILFRLPISIIPVFHITMFISRDKSLLNRRGSQWRWFEIYTDNQ